jgi:histidine triad (HIT) family protein
MVSSLVLILAILGQTPAQATAPAPQAVPLGATYNPDNPFARILAGTLSSVVVAETDTALAFMDHAPVRPGHVLVIPKSATVSLLDSTPEQLAGVMALARCVAIAQAAAFQADGMTGLSLSQNNGAPNQHVGHIHFHLVPTYAGRTFTPAATPVPQEQLEPVAARVRAAMPERC